MLYSSLLDAVYNKHTDYVCSSNATEDMMLMVVDQKDRMLKKPLTTPQSRDTLHCLTTTLDNYGIRPCLSTYVSHIDIIHHTLQVF